ncbi:hypothetical protein JTB14_031391 [Gonioctena quinquepunctata]|nr:hypothetical protein JTB14_031391 [Gonioctena quinquepunctata]
MTYVNSTMIFDYRRRLKKNCKKIEALKLLKEIYNHKQLLENMVLTIYSDWTCWNLSEPVPACLAEHVERSAISRKVKSPKQLVFIESQCND